MALSLAGQYAMDFELVEKVTTLASEEILHFRRVLSILRRRGIRPVRRRVNPWMAAMRAAIAPRPAELAKVDRLLCAALVEARSCERFGCAAKAIDDAEIEALLAELGPAEDRHWRLFHDLAARELPAPDFEVRWLTWLEHEAKVSSRFGRGATVHG